MDISVGKGVLSPSNYNHSCQNKQTVHKKKIEKICICINVFITNPTNFAVVNKINLCDVMVVYFENIGRNQ